jgi:hypothetical protein
VNVNPVGSNSTLVPPNFGDAQIAAAPQTAGAPLAAGPGARDGLPGRPQTPFAIPRFEPATKGLLDSAAGRGSAGPRFSAPVARGPSAPSFPTVQQLDTAASPGDPAAAPGPTGTGPQVPAANPIPANTLVDTARAIKDYSGLVGSFKGIIDPNTLKLAKQVGAGASLISTLGAGKFTGGSVASILGPLATLTGSPLLATVAQGADVVNKGFKIAEGLQAGSLGGFSAVGDIAGVAASVSSLVGLPPEYGKILSGISAVSGVITGTSALSALAPALGPVGAVLSLVSFALDAFSVPVERFSQEKPFAQNLSLSGRGAIDPKTGQPAADGQVTSARSNTDNNRYWYNYQVAAAVAPIKDLNFSLTPQTISQPAPNVPYAIVSMSGPSAESRAKALAAPIGRGAPQVSPGGNPVLLNGQLNPVQVPYGTPRVPVSNIDDATHLEMRIADGTIIHLQRTSAAAGFGPDELQALQNGTPVEKKLKWTLEAESTREGPAHGVPQVLNQEQLTPIQQVPTGSSILHLDVNFGPINPITKAMRMAQDVVVSAADAAKIRATFGADSATVGGADARIEALRPQINTFTSVAPPRSDGPGGRTSGPYAPGTIEYRTTEQDQKDAGRPKLYTYANYNPGQDNASDLVERTLGDPNDKSVKVTLGSNALPVDAPQVSGPRPKVPGLKVLGDAVSGRSINTGEALVSPNGKFLAVMQPDGNFVVYNRETKAALWSSGTGGKAAGGSLAVQKDGNLAVYAPGGAAQWSSDTANIGAHHDTKLTLGDDGNLVQTDPRGNVALWSSNTGKLAQASSDVGFRGQYSLTANADEAPKIGPLLPLLLQYTASHPELHELYKGPKGERANELASGDITLVYRHLRDTGVLPKLDQLTALAGAPRGKTQREQLADIASRGPQIAALKKELGLTVDPVFLASAPSVAASSNGQTLRILEDYISGATPKALAIDANDWTDAQALDYLAANPELLDDPRVGNDLNAARGHWNAEGRIKGLAVNNANADTYLAAHPEVKAVADVSLAQPVIASIVGEDDKIDSTGTVDDKDRSVTLALPNGEGRVRLAQQNTGRGATAASIFAGISSQGQRIAATAAELNALPKSAAPSAQAVHEFATQAFIDSRLAAPPAVAKWNDNQAFNYLANNPEIIKAVGVAPEAALAHRNAYGRFEGRPESGGFDVDAYLARRPDVRKAAVAALAKPNIIAATDASITLALPNGGGSVELTQKPAAAGEAANAGTFTGTSSKGVAITMTAAELSALGSRSTQDDVRAFAIKQYVTDIAAAVAAPTAVAAAPAAPAPAAPPPAPVPSVPTIARSLFGGALGGSLRLNA